MVADPRHVQLAQLVQRVVTRHSRDQVNEVIQIARMEREPEEWCLQWELKTLQ